MKRLQNTSIVYFLFWALLTTAGCVSAPMDNYKSLTPKMEKVDVTELLGSPVTTQRRGGLDVWTYKFITDDDKVILKELHFRKGKLIYKGEPKIKPPAISKKDKEYEDYKKNLPAKKEDFKPVE